MKGREEAVSEFFNQKTYLFNTFNIDLRKSIISEWISNEYSGGRILDIGCGDGSLSLPWIDANEVVLIDTAIEMLELAKKNVDKLKPKIQPKFLNKSIFDYKTDVSFDLIFCIGVFSHTTNINSLLSQIHKLLAIKGQAILQISDISHFRYRSKESNEGHYGYELNKISRSEFMGKLNSFDFEISKAEGYSWTFFPINRLSQDLQFKILNRLRKISFLNYLSSEWLFLVTKE